MRSENSPHHPDPLRVVYGTNVIISGIIASSGPAHQAIEAWRRGDIVLLSSAEIINEVVEVLRRPFFLHKRHITSEVISRIRTTLEQYATLVVCEHRLKVVAGDPDDDKILECAIAGRADYIITGDHHLLEITSYEGIPILSLSEYPRILEEQ